MLSSKFIKFMRALKMENNEKLSTILELGRIGVRISEEYSTRIDLLEIDQCLYLSDFQTPQLEKSEKHLLNLVKTKDPLFSLMEYYDNYPYSYSDISCIFKGCLKTGVEISIKGINPTSKNNYFKNLHKLKTSLKHRKIFMPWLNQKYKVNDILDKLDEYSQEKFSLRNEIRFTKIMQESLNIYTDVEFLKRMRVPKIYSYLSSDNLIVTEYIYGTYFYELLEYKRLLYKDVLDLIKIQLFFIFKIGIFHNNLHSGNLILSDEGKIYFLDCNTISILKLELRSVLYNILRCLVEKKYKSAVFFLNSISNQKLSEEELGKLVKNIEFIRLSEISKKVPVIAKVMLAFKEAINIGMNFDEEIYPIFKSFIYLEKLAQKTKSKNTIFSDDLSQILEELEVIINQSN